MNIDHLQHRFTYLLLERVNLEKNENRFYYLAAVAVCGRGRGAQRMMPQPGLNQAQVHASPLPFTHRGLAADPGTRFVIAKRHPSPTIAPDWGPFMADGEQRERSEYGMLKRKVRPRLYKPLNCVSFQSEQLG